MKWMSFSSYLALSALVLISSGLTSNFAQAATSSTAEVSSRPILFVHGFNPFGLPENCKKVWSKMEGVLASQGFTGPMVTIGYYGMDSGCDVITSPHGSILTPIEDSSKDFAWYVYDNYSSKNIAVDVVAHSMGGLLLRYALYRSSVGDANFPPYLNIVHATTLGTPFKGYSILAESCHLVPVNVECDEMFPLSSFIEGLKTVPVPQGPNGTIWSNVASNADFTDNSDGVVNSSSANSMDIPATSKMVLPWHMFVFHTLYKNNNTVIAWVVNSLSATASATANVVENAHAFAQAVMDGKAISRTPAFQHKHKHPDAIVSRSELTQDFTQMAQDQKPAVIQPYLVQNAAVDEPMGFQLTQVLPDGLFAKMGIQEGDVIRGCSDDTINQPFGDLESLESSIGEVDMSFCIVRGSKTLVKNISVQ